MTVFYNDILSTACRCSKVLNDNFLFRNYNLMTILKCITLNAIHENKPFFLSTYVTFRFESKKGNNFKKLA